MTNGGMETTDDDAESRIRSPPSAHSITRLTSYLRVQPVAVGTGEAGGGSRAASIRGAEARFKQLAVNKRSFMSNRAVISSIAAASMLNQELLNSNVFWNANIANYLSQQERAASFLILIEGDN